MTKLALLDAAALLSAAVAAPAVAQEVVYNPDYCAQFYPNANSRTKDPTVHIPAISSCVPRFAAPMRGGPVPVRWASNTTLAAAVAIMPAID